MNNKSFNSPPENGADPYSVDRENNDPEQNVIMETNMASRGNPDNGHNAFVETIEDQMTSLDVNEGLDDKLEKPCQLRSRKSLLNDVCKRQMVNVDPKAVIWGLDVNQEKHTLFCRLNKAGSTAMKGYLKHVNKAMIGAPIMPTARLDTWEHRGGIPQKVYTRVMEIPLGQYLQHFSNYTKVIIVRHPLQRFVSSYYETVITKRSLVVRELNVTNIAQYVTKVMQNEEYQGKMRSGSMNWADIQESCFPCIFKYDYILKTETIDRDMEELKEALGMKNTRQSPKGHVNPNLGKQPGYGNRKYDKILKDLEADRPDLFEYVLAKYEQDMEMFGYQWLDQASLCHGSKDNCC